MSSQPGTPYAQLVPNAKAKGKGKRKGKGKLQGAGSQPLQDAEGFYWLEGVKLPWFWPMDPRTGLPIHKLFRAMSKDYNELWPVRPRPPDYPDRFLTENEQKFRCFDAFDAVDQGSYTTSPFIHCSGTEAGARWFLNAGRDRRNTPHILFCKVNLVTLYKKGTFHQNSFIDLSTEKAWNEFFTRGPTGYHERLRDQWNYAMENAINHDEYLICWRGEVPLEVYEVTPLNN